jgi:signal transduction histidine kinase
VDLTPLLATVGTLVLERLPDGRFERRGGMPTWCASLGIPAEGAVEIQELFPFLEIFLPDAEVVWQRAAPRADSGFWTETSGDEVLHLEATALCFDGSALLVIRRKERLFAEQERVLQRARELRLTHESLVREIDQKEILVHSVVHDLAAPLNGILGALSMLGELPLGPDAKRWTRLALEAATRQRQLIADILDMFTAEYGELIAPPDPTTAPDLTAAIDEVAAQVEPAAISRGLTLRHQGGGRSPVLADRGRLVRVLVNLVENALRHSPSGGTVRLSTEREDSSVRVNVDDEGQGVPAEMVPHLFERFGRRLGDVSGSGVGLYFCRITVEQWGGGIGYERRPGRSRFWIRLIAVAEEGHGQVAHRR